MARKKKIGVLTGGGDVPGLNPCLKQVVLRALEAGWEAVGIRRGWGGLAEYRIGEPEWNKRCVLPLTAMDVRTIDRTGGTFLHTSRTNPASVREKDMPEHLRAPGITYPHDITPTVLKNLEDIGIDALIPIGGDDTLSFAAHLNKERFPQIAIPKTMDNDVFGTDYCIGFGTAVSRSVDYITQLRTPVGSHERVGLIELFGRNSGETALLASYLAGVDRALISEVHFDPEKLAAFCMQDKKNNPSHYCMVTISEGAQMVGGKIVEYGQADAYGHKKLGGIGLITGEALKKITGEDILYQQVSYLMRSGAPDSLDLMVAVNYANMAMLLIRRGASNRLVALRNGTYTSVPISTIMQGLKRVDVEELYDSENYVPKVRHVDGKPMFLY